MWKPRLCWPPGGYEISPPLLGGPELINDFVEQGEWWKHVHRSCMQVLGQGIYLQCSSLRNSRNWGRCVLWTAANMSTTGVPHSLNIRFTTSGWRLHSVVIGWFGQGNRSAITLRQPRMCLACRVMPRVCSHRNKSTTSRNRRWK